MSHELNRTRLIELADDLEEAQSDLLDVIERLKHINRKLDDQHAEAYIIDHLEILASSDHGFLSRDYNLSEWIEDVRERAHEAKLAETAESGELEPDDDDEDEDEDENDEFELNELDEDICLTCELPQSKCECV